MDKFKGQSRYPDPVGSVAANPKGEPEPELAADWHMFERNIGESG